MRYFILFAALVVLFNTPAVTQEQPVTSIPTLSIDTGSGKTSLVIHKLDVKVSVTGNIANTVFDITFYNPFDRILEGSFEFPLGEGQSVFRYALEINDKLREGVVVEKQKARVAYENTIRQNIDPGLIEKTKGNSYRTRIYPIPAKGYKRVVIGIEQSLQYNENELVYDLPLYTSEPVADFAATFIVYNSEEPEVNGSAISFSKKSNDWIATMQQKDTKLNTAIQFSVPFSKESPLLNFTGMHKGNTYFYMALPLQPEYIEKKLPQSVTLLWDVSASGARRDKEKEVAVLKEYLSGFKKLSLRFVPFNNRMGASQWFNINNGNSDVLINKIRQLNYDGGTQLGAIDLSKDSSEQVLVFTDGISTFGKKEMIIGKAPVAFINAAANADHAYMKYLALATNGIYLNLATISNEEAVRSLRYTPIQFIRADYNGNEITELVHSSGGRSGLSMAGILKAPAAKITLHFGYGNTVVSSSTYTLLKEDEIASVPRSWAALKAAELEMQPKKNKEAITKLGKEFSLVTSNTSLLVLDRVEDYVEYEITPPDELKASYDSLLLVKQQEAMEEKMEPLNESIAVMKELKEWYKKEYPKKTKQKSKAKVVTNASPAVEQRSESVTINDSPPVAAAYNAIVVADSVSSVNIGTVRLTASAAELSEVVVTKPLEGRAAGVMVPASPGSSPNINLRGYASLGSSSAPLIIVNGIVYNGSIGDINKDDIISVTSMNNSAAVGLYGSRAANGVIIVTTKDDVEEKKVDTGTYMWGLVDSAVSGEIEVNDIKLDASYMKELEKATPANYYSVYLKLKEDNAALPSFYADVARFLYKKGNKTLALQVLSNIAELQLEDAELLRILGAQLDEWNEKTLALETFKEVLDMREEHPQSWRDLALANAQAGNYQEAADGLYHILSNNWDDRFDRMTSVVINEFNALIATHKNRINTTAYNKELIYSMPLDVRIVINWTSDDSDIDLWVHDPLNESCGYTFPLTNGGGKLSGDITSGFGPEEYCMKKAVDGSYTIEVNYFGETRQTLAGPISVKAEMYTNYGTPQQKKQVINVRLVSEKDTIKLGVLRFKRG